MNFRLAVGSIQLSKKFKPLSFTNIILQNHSLLSTTSRSVDTLDNNTQILCSIGAILLCCIKCSFFQAIQQKYSYYISVSSTMSEQKQTVFNNIRVLVQKKVNETISEYLSNKAYNVNEAQIWTNQICDDILRNITNSNKNFKFIANCIIMQKADCGLNISGSCFWDNEVDGTVTVKWDASTMICIVNVFGCAL